MDQVRIPHYFPSRLEALGLSPLVVLQQACVPVTLLQQERFIVSLDQWFTLWHVLETLNQDPALGLKLGSDTRIEQYSPVGIAALSTRSFYEALIKLSRYKRLFCSEEMNVVEEDGQWHIEAVWNKLQQPAPRLLIDSIFASLMLMAQRGSRQALYPERVTFAREPLHSDVYESFFHCPIEFNAEHNALIYNHQAIQTPFHTVNPDLLAILVPQLEKTLREDAEKQTFSDQVRALLRNRLPNKQPTIEDIARDFNMSARTFQRQLASDGTSFQKLLEAARREMARHYLSASALDLNEIAFLLGYEETSSFHRAFHSWEGVSPGQWRIARQ